MQFTKNLCEVSNTSEKKHNTAETSVESWKAINRDGSRLTEKNKLFEAIRTHGPITSRHLSEITQTERTSVCRALYDLLNEIEPQIKIAYEAKCPVTKRTVQYYSHIDWKLEPLTQGMLWMEAGQS